MYNILIVDDEYLIREDLVNMIDWNSLPLNLFGTAEDGLDALKQIQNNPPDIIITDIRMPEIDGIELIKQVRISHSNIKFILFSGYSEFSYAQSAMKYGVKHYLLKPSTEAQLETVLKQTIQELDETTISLQAREIIEKKYSTIKEGATEHYFKMYLTGDSYGENAWNHFAKHVDSTVILDEGTLVVFQLCSIHELIHVFALQNIAKEIIGESHILVESKFDSIYAFTVHKDYLNFLSNKLEQIVEKFNSFYEFPLICLYHSYSCIKDLPNIYDQLITTIHRNYFHLHNKVTQPIDISKDYNSNFSYDCSALNLAMESIQTKLINTEIKQYLSKLYLSCYGLSIVNRHLDDLYHILLSYSNQHSLDSYNTLYKNAKITEKPDAIEFVLKTIGASICKENDSFLRENYSSVVNQLINLIHNRYNNDNFTLKHIAKNILFLNKDYLSKQFKKETNYGFSEYLSYYRMETAKSLIRHNDVLTTTQLASKVGYGSNVSYFSKSFKKYTGKTPKDFF